MKVIVIFECHSGRKRNPRFYFHSNSKTVVGYFTPGKRGSQSSSALSGTRQGTAFSHRQERLTARWVSERVRTTRRGRHQKCGGEQAETRTYVVVDQKHSTGGRKSRATLRYGTARHGTAGVGLSTAKPLSQPRRGCSTLKLPTTKLFG